TIGQIVLMEVLKDRKSFLLTDTGITVQPSLEQLQSLLEQMVNVIRDLGCETPRIGLMAATEKVTSKMPETEQIARLVEWSRERYPEPEVQVSGPLSFDLAYASKAGERKRLDDVVIGHANGMLFPNLLSANLTVKAIMYTADCRFGGILCGTSAPVVFMSRADDVPTRLNSLAYTLELISGRE
ncbi:MAG: phosphate butyryltransferase, partial [Planctomycetaceae bacterium]|nr:phosphate butyryltransferase [Planctomycetaceae bacterium]